MILKKLLCYTSFTCGLREMKGGRKINNMNFIKKKPLDYSDEFKSPIESFKPYPKLPEVEDYEQKTELIEIGKRKMTEVNQQLQELESDLEALKRDTTVLKEHISLEANRVNRLNVFIGEFFEKIREKNQELNKLNIKQMLDEKIDSYVEKAVPIDYVQNVVKQNIRHMITDKISIKNDFLDKEYEKGIKILNEKWERLYKKLQYADSFLSKQIKAEKRELKSMVNKAKKSKKVKAKTQEKKEHVEDKPKKPIEDLKDM